MDTSKEDCVLGGLAVFDAAAVEIVACAANVPAASQRVGMLAVRHRLPRKMVGKVQMVGKFEMMAGLRH